MTVILIYYKDKLLRVAKNYDAAINYLMEQDYLTEDTEVFAHHYINEIIGENWASKIRYEWDIEDFNTFWDGYYKFSLLEEEVIE